jgi:hypothetical protein
MKVIGERYGGPPGEVPDDAKGRAGRAPTEDDPSAAA